MVLLTASMTASACCVFADFCLRCQGCFIAHGAWYHWKHICLVSSMIWIYGLVMILMGGRQRLPLLGSHSECGAAPNSLHAALDILMQLRIFGFAALAWCCLASTMELLTHVWTCATFWVPTIRIMICKIQIVAATHDKQLPRRLMSATTRQNAHSDVTDL